MKKTITLPDGSVEVVEGTAEEIATYEKSKREQTAEGTKSKKKILNEETIRAIAREEAQKVVPTVTKYEFHSHCVGCAKCQPQVERWPWPQVTPIWIAPLEPLRYDDPYRSYTVKTSDSSGELRMGDLPEESFGTSSTSIIPFCSN